MNPIPDLKKAQEDKLARMSGSPVAKASASVLTVAPRTTPKTPRERLAELAASKTTWIAAFLVIGGLAFAVMAWKFTTAPESSGASVAGAGSSAGMKIRFASPNDPAGLIAPEERARAARERAGAGGMRFDLIKDADAAKKAADAAQEAADGAGQDMNYDESGTSRAGTASAGGASGATNGSGAGSGPGGSANGSAPRLNASSSFKLQGMRRVSGTAGFRSITSHRSIPSRTIMNRGTGANSSDAAGRGAGFAAGEAGGSGASGSASGRSVAAGAGGDAGGGASASGGGGGGGGGGGNGDGTNTPSPIDIKKQQIQDLMQSADHDAKEADKNKEYAEILAAGGHLPQAEYHREKAARLKDSAEQKSAEAKRLTDEVLAETLQKTDPTPTTTMTPARTR